MSTPASPSSSLHPTRRQLDELDALMEQLLDLPVNPVEDKSPSAVEPVIAESAEASPFAGFSSDGTPSFQMEEGKTSAADVWKQFNLTATQRGASTLADGSGLNDRGQEDDGLPPTTWLWPVVAINRLYDTLIGGLRSPGRVMRGVGRSVLGWIGLLLLATAFAWVLFDWLQWAG